MAYRLCITISVLALANMQASAAILLPPVASLPVPLPYSPLIAAPPPVVDFQALTALSCGCGRPACGCGGTVDCRIPTSVSPVVPTCGCGLPTCGCGLPSCGCGVPPVAYSAGALPVVDVGCSCSPVLTTPLLPPFAPVVGCAKYLRQVCVQPPFL